MRRSRRRGLVPSLLVLWIAAAACQLASSGTPLADSDEHAGIFTFTGEEDEYEFTADIGGHVAMRAVRNSGALYPGLELIDPDGGQIDITSDASATGIDHTTVLEAALARDGALGVREAVRLMTQVLEALASAHARGIVHRDLKPANLMLSAAGVRRSAQVLDSGLGGLGAGRPAGPSR